MSWVIHLVDATRECKGREFHGAGDDVSQLAKMSLPTNTLLAFYKSIPYID
jgi:hypothetical protein